MASNYLITGYWGEPHVTAENDRGIHAAMFGTGRFVLPVGEQFKAEYIGNNTVRLYDGKLMDNGAAAGIPVGEYVDLQISNAGQGMNRNDLIVFQYSQDASTLVESGTFVVIQGTEVSGTASDPELTQDDLLSGEATFDQMAMWRISVSGTAISAPVQMFTVYENPAHHAANKENPHGVTAAQVGAAPSSHKHSADDVTSGTLPIARGGTGAVNADAARENLNAVSKSGDTLNGTLKFKNGTSVICPEVYRNTTSSKAAAESGMVRIAVSSTTGGMLQLYTGVTDADQTAMTESNRLTLTTTETTLMKPLNVESGGTGATTAEAARENLGAASKCVNVTTAGTDLNDYVEEGWYFFTSSAVAPTNIPNGSNGWLQVVAVNNQFVKQIWYRLGTPGSNDFLTYVRTYASTVGWGKWTRLLTNRLISGEFGTALPTDDYTNGRIFFKKVT